MSFSIALDRAIPDFRIASGRLVLSHGANTVRDRLFVGLSMNLGDDYLDINAGLPWYGEDEAPAILGGNMGDAEVAARIRRRALQDAEVLSVTSLDMVRAAARHTVVTLGVKVQGGEVVTLEI